jgi:hypothetical protein
MPFTLESRGLEERVSAPGGMAHTRFVPQHWSSRDVLLVGAWVTFTAALFAVVRYHEPWFDEAQAWLIARDSSLFEMLFKRMSYEGSPGLWHLMLWLLIRVGLPFRAISYLTVALASISAAVILRYAPFPPLIRVLFIFGYFPAYQYSILARSYVLNLLLIPLIAHVFPSRRSKPLSYCLVLAALANANAQGFLFAAVLFGELVYWLWRARPQIRTYVVPLIAFTLSAAFAALQAYPAKDTYRPELAVLPSDIITRLILHIGWGFVELGHPTGVPKWVVGVLWASLLLAITMTLPKKAGTLAITSILITTLLAFGSIVYSGLWHAGVTYLAWVFALWISWPAINKLSRSRRRMILAAIVFIFSLQVYETIDSWQRDIRKSYCGAPMAARRIRQFLEENPGATMACFGFKSFAVQPYFQQNICSNFYNGAKHPSYFDWRFDRTREVPQPVSLWAFMRPAVYDSVLVADFAPTSLARYLAGRIGYCVDSHFDGELIWKGYAFERNSLTLFRKCQPLSLKSR